MEKIIVFDDDPTGSQTVHSCPLVTGWDPVTLRRALGRDSPFLFILTNTRALHVDAARAALREACRNVKTVLAERADIDPLIVSRSDSTLRGHFAAEIEVITEELGPFDACFVVPAFFEGGRVTRDGVHYVIDERGCWTPAHETEFARDSVFGYRSSYLPAYIEEKTAGAVRACEVLQLPECEDSAQYRGHLQSLNGGRYVTLDAATQQTLNRFAEAVSGAAREGRRFLFRSAASLLTALGCLGEQPYEPDAMGLLARGAGPGLVVVGSHVGKSTLQLEALLETAGTAGIEVDVHALPERHREEWARATREIDAIMSRGQTPVVYTSRTERGFPTAQERLRFGEAVSRFLVDLVAAYREAASFIIAKGGITSNDVLREATGSSDYTVKGQVLPGVSVVVPDGESPPWRGPIVIFPGNVGNRNALALAYRRMRAETLPERNR